MRTIHYSIRLGTVLVPVLLTYCGVALVLHQVIQVHFLITLCIITPAIERLWALLDWMSPVMGEVNRREQKRMLNRIVERQLSRTWRYGSRLVIAAIRTKKRTSLHIIEQNLRDTDIVLRRFAKLVLVLMPETTIEQSSHAFHRLAALLPIQDIVIMDERMFRQAVNTLYSESGARNITARELRLLCRRLLSQKFASITSHEGKDEMPAIYPIFEENAVERRHEAEIY